MVRVEDRPLPQLEGKGLDGAPLSAAAFRGKVLVVSVWATWCLDCERDQPGFVRVAGRYAGKDVAFLGVNPEETSTAQPTAWVRRYGVPYPSIEDPSGRFAASLGYTGLPATYVVDRAGNDPVLDHRLDDERGNAQQLDRSDVVGGRLRDADRVGGRVTRARRSRPRRTMPRGRARRT